jgi:glutamyl-tRNA reductase
MGPDGRTTIRFCRSAAAVASLTDLHVWGIDYRTAATDIREQAYLAPDRIRLFQEAFARQACGVASVVLCTCNRTELYLEVRGGCGARSALAKALEAAGIDSALFFGRHGNHLSGAEAAEHLYRVCAGLESMVLGENEVMSQAKNAYRLAEENHAQLGSVLSRVFQGAFRAGKRVRAETAISAGPVSMASAAVDEAQRNLGDLRGLHGLLIGAGKTGSLAAEHFLRRGIGKLTIVNRSLARAQDVARKVRAAAERDVCAKPFSELESSLADADIVLTATGSPDPIITKPLLSGLESRFSGRVLHIFDIAVPRDVQLDVRDLGFVRLTGIDELSELVREQIARRVGEVPAAERIIATELGELMEWGESLQMKPAVKEFRSFLEGLASREMGYIRREQPPDTAAAIEVSLKHFVQRLLQRPARQLRTAVSDDERRQDVRSLIRLFELGGEAGHQRE